MIKNYELWPKWYHYVKRYTTNSSVVVQRYIVVTEGGYCSYNKDFRMHESNICSNYRVWLDKN